jgi:serine/threonine-protein kinase
MLQAGSRIGPYLLVSKLGKGGFGVVWLAERRTAITTTRVALKLPLDDEIDLGAIKREADLWVQASGHPNVLPIIEANIYDNQIVIVSEYATGGSLVEWLARNGGVAPSMEAASETISGILAGLGFLHSKNIIHRDLKPANVLLQEDIPRLADFGIARVLKTTLSSGFIAGTPAYMAPEAFDGERSVQTDLWSVGVIFYQLLAGRLPFPNTDLSALMKSIIVNTPAPLPEYVPEPLRVVIERAMRKDTSQRFRSASEMRGALREAMQRSPQQSFRMQNPSNTAPTIRDADSVYQQPPISNSSAVYSTDVDRTASRSQVLTPAVQPMAQRPEPAQPEVNQVSQSNVKPISTFEEIPLDEWSGKRKSGIWAKLMSLLEDKS